MSVATSRWAAANQGTLNTSIPMPVTRRLVAEAIDRLLDDGPVLGRPLVDRIAGPTCIT
ncbi:hypothetical protein ACQP1W_31540 [Spirillospora sp. CA-255316]